MANELTAAQDAAGADGTSDIFDSLPDTIKETRVSVNSSSSMVRLPTIKASSKNEFRLIVDGEEDQVASQPELKVIIVANTRDIQDNDWVGRKYFDSPYNADNRRPPTCWSQNALHPHESVANKQADSCAMCPHKASKACKWTCWCAVCLPDDPDRIFQIQLAPSSIWGKKGDDLGLHAFVKMVKDHGYPLHRFITTMYFDQSVPYQKLFFGIKDKGDFLADDDPRFQKLNGHFENKILTSELLDYVTVRYSSRPEEKAASGFDQESVTKDSNGFAPAKPEESESPAETETPAEPQEKPKVRTRKKKAEKPAEPEAKSGLDDILSKFAPSTDEVDDG